MPQILSQSRQVVLALVPHPDDAEFYAGGTLAKMIAEGAQVYIAVATDGRCGSYEHGSEALARIRADEMQHAATLLGAEPPILLGHADMGLDALPAGVLREQFMRLIRQLKPHVVIAEDPYAPFEAHPDHRAVAWAATEAISGAPLPLICPEQLSQGLAPHFVVEKYFYGNSPAVANRFIDITQTIDRCIAALTAHRSQVVFLVEGILRQARLAGLDVGGLFGPAASDPAVLLDWGVRARAAEVGRQAEMAYAEAFRYVRFDPLIEGMLGDSHERSRV